MSAAHRGRFTSFKGATGEGTAARRLLLSALSFVAAGALFAEAARADTASPIYVPGSAKPEGDKKDEDEKKEGFSYAINVGATFSLINTQSVIGQVDGLTTVVGLEFASALEYRRGKSEWRGTVNLGAGLTRTPALGKFVKSRDNLALETFYLYHAVPWAGPFARVALNTSMFRGADVRPTPSTYLITRPDGAVDQVIAGQLTLSDPFKPLFVKQSLGAFLQPVARDSITIEAGLGAGAREMFASSELALNDDDKTGEIEIKELTNVYQAGAELNASIGGAFAKKGVSYKLVLEFMTPLAHTDLPPGDERGAFELTNVELIGTLSFKLVEWASLDYEIKALRLPQILDTFQVQNSLLLTLGVGLATEKAKE